MRKSEKPPQGIVRPAAERPANQLRRERIDARSERSSIGFSGDATTENQDVRMSRPPVEKDLAERGGVKPKSPFLPTADTQVMKVVVKSHGNLGEFSQEMAYHSSIKNLVSAAKLADGRAFGEVFDNVCSPRETRDINTQVGGSTGGRGRDVEKQLTLLAQAGAKRSRRGSSRTGNGSGTRRRRVSTTEGNQSVVTNISSLGT
ncbi:hypothetical protein [Amycolatopsis sp. cmx-11-32]|uniref:hypothetical protein n=1 Tax=Amycolatopsis sp. cmx-11-32 TaxID=2785796 RepID=UPI0039E2A5E5